MKGNERMKKKTFDLLNDLLKEFKKRWYPAPDLPKIEDFIAWLEKQGYEIREKEKNEGDGKKDPIDN